MEFDSEKAIMELRERVGKIEKELHPPKHHWSVVEFNDGTKREVDEGDIPCTEALDDRGDGFIRIWVWSDGGHDRSDVEVYPLSTVKRYYRELR